MNLTPYLLFDGHCAEAMAFYQSCFGGELVITKVGASTMMNQMPKESYDKVLYANLKSGAMDISASDWLYATRTPKQGNAVCLYITGDTYHELNEIFEKLSVGADKNLLDVLRDMPFGSYGALTDKYRVRWMFKAEKKHPA